MELPAEVWGLVLAELEEVQDFARAQLVSKPFNALIRDNCWKKVKKIYIQSRNVRAALGNWLIVNVDTAVLEQKLLFPLDDAPFLMESLLQNASKTESIGINFYNLLTARRDPILVNLFDSLVAARIKVKEVELRCLDLLIVLPRMTPRAVARFLSANAETITSLEVRNFMGRETVPPQLLEAFRECRAIETLKIFNVYVSPLSESLLRGKRQLKFLWFDDSRLEYRNHSPISALFESGAQLRYVCCDRRGFQYYMSQMKQMNRVRDHPLRTVETLEIDLQGKGQLPTLDWVHFPNLQQYNSV